MLLSNLNRYAPPSWRMARGLSPAPDDTTAGGTAAAGGEGLVRGQDRAGKGSAEACGFTFGSPFWWDEGWATEERQALHMFPASHTHFPLLYSPPSSLRPATPGSSPLSLRPPTTATAASTPTLAHPKADRTAAAVSPSTASKGAIGTATDHPNDMEALLAAPSAAYRAVSPSQDVVDE